MKAKSLILAGTIAIFANMITACSAQVASKPAVNYENPQQTEVISLQSGRLTGVYTQDKKVRVYAGIPYAAPPVGDLRWKTPQPVNHWNGVLAADHFGPIAMQGRLPLFVSNGIAKAMGMPEKESEEPMSEDCLYLNVWTPAKMQEGGCPVLVYIHGGSLRTGAGSDDYCNGEEAARNGVVMVTINYRLGAFGYLALPELSKESGTGSGNYGVLDQIAALQWVQQNISAFGGDPNKVTIAGESAGSQSVSALCASPLAKGLFRAAIGESATFAAPHLASDLFSQQKSEDVGLKFMKEYKASTLKELRAMSADELMKHELSEVSITIDGYALPKSAYQTYLDGEQSDVPLLIGYNAKEGGLFTLGQDPNPQELRQKVCETFGDSIGQQILKFYPAQDKKEAKDALMQIVGVYAIGWPTDRWAEVQSRTGKSDVYRYYYTYRQETDLGAQHGTEMEFAYYNPGSQSKWSDADYAFSRKMFTYWMNFVKYGNPNGDETDSGQPAWTNYRQSPDKIMELGSHIGMKVEPNQNMFDLFNTLK